MEENNKDDLSGLNPEDVEVIYDSEDDYYKTAGGPSKGAAPEISESAPSPEAKEPETEKLSKELEELNNKYLRLYAEFENYRKRVNKDKEELVKYANESLLYELLPSLDNLEIALKHASNDTSSKGLFEGVEITLRELYRALEKFGLKPIKTESEAFNPEFHHAVSRVETDTLEENMIVEEFRKGFMYKDKVLRASMVSVSQKPFGNKNIAGQDSGTTDN